MKAVWWIGGILIVGIAVALAFRNDSTASQSDVASGVSAAHTMSGSDAPNDRPPNILLIVVDDLGYGDLGFQGGDDIPTPNLDSLAANGVRLTNGYVSSTWCSPTRAGLLTGRYQQRFGEHGHEGTPDNALSLAETTLADHLGRAGYTTGLIGKWHLGTSADHHPLERGFDEFFGFLAGAHTFLPDIPIIIFPDRTGLGADMGASAESRARYQGLILRSRQTVAESAYLTEAFGREAVSFIDRHQADAFFLTLAFNAPHTPMQATDSLLERFDTEDPVRHLYNAMTFSIDEAVGAVMDALERASLINDTLIFFISDNGGPTVTTYAYNASSNAPLRGSKGTALEGGIRVPFVVSWPGRLPRGATYDDPAIQLDILPTALAAAGVAQPANLDGVDLMPFLTGKRQTPPHESLFWRSFRQMAIRHGDWKLVTYPVPLDSNDMPHEYPPYSGPLTEPHLYNVREDAGETLDLAASEPALVAELAARWNAWNAELPPPR